MKTKILAFILGAILTQPGFAAIDPGGGEECFEVSASDCGSPDYTLNAETASCARIVTHCYTDINRNTYLTWSCDGCISGATARTDTINIGNCPYTFQLTRCSCSYVCSNCTSDSDFVSAGAGYEKKTTANCECSTCKKTTEYRCAAGYWGSPTSSSSGCTRCPQNGNSAPGSTRQTDCYITGNFSDSTGSGNYTSSCYYKN